MKSDLKENLGEDLDIARGAMKEIIEQSRKINKNIIEELDNSDYSLLEEYGIVTKNILDAAKLLSEIHASQPKTLKDINNLEEPKKKINLDELLD